MGRDSQSSRTGFLVQRDKPSLVPFRFGLIVSPQALPSREPRGRFSVLLFGNLLLVASSSDMVLVRWQWKERCTVVHTLVLLPAGTIYRGTPETLFRCQCTRTSVAPTNVDFNMPFHRHSPTQNPNNNTPPQPQTHHTY